MAGDGAIRHSYYHLGRLPLQPPGDKGGRYGSQKAGSRTAKQANTPFPDMQAKGLSHCGNACCVCGICAEWLAFLVPDIAVWLGWHRIFEEEMFAV
jgi:hypothetical protein